jgi:hypothetical protein
MPAASQIILSLSAMQPLYHACDAGFAIGASIIDANIAALRPSHFPEFVAKCGKERLIFCVVLGRRHQHANPARPIYLVWSAVAPWMNANQPRLGSTSLFIDPKMPDSPSARATSAVREVRDHLAANRFVLRSDVKSHYASINHVLPIDQLAAYIKDRPIPQLRGQNCTPNNTQRWGRRVRNYIALDSKVLDRTCRRYAKIVQLYQSRTNRSSATAKAFYPCIFFSRI